MTTQQPIMLAITGGIACGKSESGRILEKQGFEVLDADCVAHDLMKHGSPVFERIVNAFGPRVVSPEGEIDRAVLGQCVFENRDRLELLNQLVHPAVIEFAEAWKQERCTDASVLVPLLFEAGWTQGWDAIICVGADEEVIFQRLEKRGLSRADAQKRMDGQLPLNQKKEKSDFCIENNGTLNELEQALLKAVQQVRSRGQTNE